LVLCRNYYNSVNPPGLKKQDSSSDIMFNTLMERAANHKKVRQWFLNPGYFRSEIEAAEKQHGSK
jgi:hypothetical protein